MISILVFFISEEGSTIALMAIFVNAFCVVSTYSIVYLMIELRVPHKRLGSSIVIVYTFA